MKVVVSIEATLKYYSEQTKINNYLNNSCFGKIGCIFKSLNVYSFKNVSEAPLLLSHLSQYNFRRKQCNWKLHMGKCTLFPEILPVQAEI